MNNDNNDDHDGDVATNNDNGGDNDDHDDHDDDQVETKDALLHAINEEYVEAVEVGGGLNII